MKAYTNFILPVLILITVLTNLNAQDNKQPDTLQVVYINFNNLKWADRAIGATLSSTTEKNVQDSRSRGSYFQWGRNIPIVYNDTLIPVVKGPLSATKAAQTNAFITSEKEFRYDWLDIRNDSLWASPEKQPCPAGWRLPTKEEAQEIMPFYSKTQNTHFFKIPSKKEAEKIKGIYTDVKTDVKHEEFQDSVHEGYGIISQYISNGSNTIYAQKTKKDSTSYRIRWEYLGPDSVHYLKITLIPNSSFAGKKSLSAISKMNWDTNSEILLIPASGFLYCITGELLSKGEFGYYWTSTPDDVAASRMSFHPTHSFVYSMHRAHGFPIRYVRK